MTPGKKYPSIQELISLTGRKALITGGAMGIGFAIARRLAEAGANVAIADINEDKGRSAVEELLSAGYLANYVRCDVSREESVKEAVPEIISRLGGLDILVNNAGIFPFTPLFQLTSADIERTFAVNINGTLYCTREAGRWMIEQKRSGCVINLASVDSVHPSHKGLPVYDASKGAVLTLTKSLAKDLGPYGIRVNAIAPGGILTEGMIAQSRNGETGRSVLKEFMARLPLGKMGIADDIARVALFLASDLSSYMTGSLVVVDGGYLSG